jgi:hypothetical protein
MSENYDKIIDMVDKYYYFIASTKRIILLGSSNNLSDVKSQTIKKLEPKIDQFIGKKLIFVKITNTYDDYKDKESNNLKFIGGPIAFEFMFGLIDNNKKIKNEKDSGNNKIYLSKKYIKENIDNISKNIKKIVKKYLTNVNTKTFMDIQVI